MAKAKVVITAQNNMSQGIKSAQGSLTSFQKTAQAVGDTLKSAFAVTAILASLAKLGSACKASFSAFETMDRKYKQLQISLGNTTAYNKAVSTIERLAKQTLSSKDDIESMVSELAALGKSSDEIDKISSAAVYLSNVTGKDLNSSMTTLMNTYNGTTTQLKKLGIDVSNLTSEELANGAAVDVVIGKFQSLSEAMSEASASQHLSNIKDTLGDIQQGFGQMISAVISPMLSELDTGLETFQGKFQGFVDKATIVIKNFPEVWSRFLQMVKDILSRLINPQNFFENLMSLFNAFKKGLLLQIQMTISNMSNMLHLSLEAIPNAVTALLDGIRNYAMAVVSDICNDTGFNLQELINKIGNWMMNSPVGKVIDKIITNVVNGIKLIGNLIKNIPAMFDLVVNNIGPIISNLWLDIKNGFLSTTAYLVSRISDTVDTINLGQRIENIKVAIQNAFGHMTTWFKNIGDTGKDVFRYIGDIMKATFSWDTIKNSALSMIEKFCNFFIDAINSLIPSWFQYIPGLKNVTGLSRVSLVDENYTNPYANIKGITTGSNTYTDIIPKTIYSSFALTLDNFADTLKGAIGERSDWSDISAQFTSLLNPVFEKWTQDSSVSIGESLAKWEMKSADEYYKASKKSFSSIGSFLKEWGEDFIDDNLAAWDDMKEVLSSIGTTIFGDDVSSFSAWLDDFIREMSKQTTILSSSLGGGTSATSSSASSSASGSLVPNDPSSIWAKIQSEGKNWISGIETSILDKWNGGNALSEGSWMTAVFNEIVSGVMEWIGAIQPLVNIIDNACNPLKLILHIIEGFVEVLGPALTSVFQPVVDLFKGIGSAIGQWLLPILDVLGTWISQIVHIIGNIIFPILSMLTPIFQLIATLLEPITGLLSLLGKGILVLISPIKWLADALSWLGEWVKYFGKCIRETISHLFDLRNADYSGKPGSFSSNAFDLSSAFEQYDSLMSGNVATSAVNASATSVQNASYTGSGSVTLNVYIEGNVIGDGGMTTLAKQLRDEFEALDYYGI